MTNLATSQLPFYANVADNHNIANGQVSWADPQTWANKLGNVGKFIASSALSGTNSFYNTGVTVGRWAGLTDAPDRETQTWITGLDTDLGKYYSENKEATDLTGFVLGSLAPGIGGVRLFNAGQTVLKTALKSGQVGGMSGKALGLLVPKTDEYLAAAASQINQSTTAVKLINANTVRAIEGGFRQNTLEAAAFEIAAIATQFKSPTLENMDGGDLVKNILIGGALGGVIGGTFATAGLFGKIKLAVRREDAIRQPFLARPALAEQTPSSDRIVQLAYDSDMGGAQPIVLRNADGSIVPTPDAQLFADRVNKNAVEIRGETVKLASGDVTLGNLVADISSPIKGTDGKLPVGFAQGYFENFSGAASISRITQETSLEIAARKAARLDEEIATPIGVRYFALHGENIGEVIAGKPMLPTLADLIDTPKGILKAVSEYKFGKEVTPTTVWSAMNLTARGGTREAEARYIWALRPEEGGVLKEIPAGSLIGRYDIPLLERAYTDRITNIRITSGEGPSLEVMGVSSSEELLKLIKESKEEVAAQLGEKFSLLKSSTMDPELSSEAVARIVNVRTSYLEGTWSENSIEDLFANQTNARVQQQLRDARGLSKTTPGAVDNPLLLPRHAKIVYKLDSDLSATTPHIVDAITFYKGQQQVYEEGNKRVFANITRQSGQLFPDINDGMMNTAFRAGSGNGLFSFENSNYGTLGSTMAFVGSLTRNMKQEFRKNTSEALESALVRLGGKQEAAIEFETLNQKVTRSPSQFVLRETTLGDHVLVSKEAITQTVVDGAGVSRKQLADVADYELLEEGVNSFAIRNEETLEALRAHINVTGNRTSDMKQIRAQQGLADYKDIETFRPIRPNLKQYPHFAFVVNDKVTGAGHMTMIHAASEKELEALANKVPSQYRTIFKREVEEFKQASGQFEYSRTLNESYLNSDLAKNGVFSNFFSKTDPAKIVDDILQQNLRETDTLVTEAVRLRYEAPFTYLEDFARQYSKAATSKLASRAETIEASADNPFFNYIKTALDISKINEHPLVYAFNKILDDAVSRPVQAIKETFGKIENPGQLDEVNGLLEKYGMKPAFYDADLNSLVNHTAPRGELTKFVRGANALLSRFVLGLDPLNALNNAIGSNILRGTELTHLYRAIRAGDSEIAGELSKLAKIRLPGTDNEIFSPTKLTSNAIANFWKDRATDGSPIGPLTTKYKNMGIIRDRVEQLKMLADDFTLTGTETVQELTSRTNTAFARAKTMAQTAGDIGERLTGNALAEEFNRFISANVMDQLTDIAVRRGLMDSKTAQTYINTFVNRAEGNIVASQRPLIFQGPIGQAVSLFQSYQFNLLQQLFRYSAEGTKKDLAVLAGLQQTMYGMQSMPAFQAINVHIIGQLSGNTEHRDTYDAVYGMTGKVAGDFLLYGLPSNLLFGWGEGGGTNIYSRGDVNPRQITILPTNLQELPIYQGWGKFFASVFDTAKKISGGANMGEALLQGIEHNGISRPLAGIAQTLQAIGNDGVAYSTSSKGSILYQNDLMSLATLSRVAGGRPLNEAIVNDAMFRVKKYEASRREKMLGLGERVKQGLIQGNELNEEDVVKFSQRYAELGGKQANFNKYMMDMYRSANNPQSQKLQQSLTSPFSYKVQYLMGGDENE